MPKKGHSKEKVADICRKLGVEPGFLLHMEEAVRRHGRTGVAGDAAVAGGEQPAEAVGGGPVAGPAENTGKLTGPTTALRRLQRVGRDGAMRVAFMSGGHPK
jgi:hypothetical protein